MKLDKEDIATANEMAKTLQQSKNDELIVVGNLLAFLLKEREALAQQPQNEVRGLSHSNEQSKCNHTKTITRADIDGNQIETTCGECGERVAQQPQDVVRGLLSNEQVERARSKAYDMIDRFLRNNMDDNVYAEYSKALDIIYTHPPVPYVVEPRTAQPKDPLVINSQEKASEFIEKTLWEVIDVAAMFPKAKPNPRTWEHLMVYSPQPKPLTDEQIDAIADKFTVHTGEMWEPELCIEFNDSCKSVHSFARAIEAAHGIRPTDFKE